MKLITLEKSIRFSEFNNLFLSLEKKNIMVENLEVLADGYSIMLNNLAKNNEDKKIAGLGERFFNLTEIIDKKQEIKRKILSENIKKLMEEKLLKKLNSFDFFNILKGLLNLKVDRQRIEFLVDCYLKCFDKARKTIILNEFCEIVGKEDLKIGIIQEVNEIIFRRKDQPNLLLN